MEYQNLILDQYCLPYMEHNGVTILQHDNSPVHSAKRVKAFLEERNIQVLEWPALSPDLNPIENIWGYIKQKLLLKLTAASTINDVRNEVQINWTQLPQRLLLAVICSMRTRMKDVIKCSGEPLKY